VGVLLAVPGLVAAVLLSRPATLLIAFFVIAAATTGLAVGFGTTFGRAPADSGGRLRPALLAGAVVGGAGVAMSGLVQLLGAAAFLLFLLAMATSPPVIERLFHKHGTRPKGRSGGSVQVRELTTLELCRQWQDSYQALREAPTLALRLQIIEAREHCLDELERRDPDGLQAWLASAASAAGDPSRFLTGPGTT
jgi:hypothetical protein